MRAGRLRHKIYIEKRSTRQDEYGETEEVFLPVIPSNKISAEVNFDSGGKEESAGVEYSFDRVSALVRFRSWVKPEHFFTFKGVRYRVVAVLPNIRQTEMTVIGEPHAD